LARHLPKIWPGIYQKFGPAFTKNLARLITKNLARDITKILARHLPKVAFIYQNFGPDIYQKFGPTDYQKFGQTDYQKFGLSFTKKRSTNMSYYTPQTIYEKETLVHLAAVVTLRAIGTVGQRIEYSTQYLHKRYGKDPEHERVPSYYKEKYNSDEHKDALDLDVWASLGLLFVSQNTKKLKKDIKKGLHKASKKLKKFCRNVVE